MFDIASLILQWFRDFERGTEKAKKKLKIYLTRENQNTREQV